MIFWHHTIFCIFKENDIGFFFFLLLNSELKFVFNLVVKKNESTISLAWLLNYGSILHHDPGHHAYGFSAMASAGSCCFDQNG